MDGFKTPAGDPKRSASNMMFYTAIVGKSPTIERPLSPPPAAKGSLRWLTDHCRYAGHAMSGSLRAALRRVKTDPDRAIDADAKRLGQAH